MTIFVLWRPLTFFWCSFSRACLQAPQTNPHSLSQSRCTILHLGWVGSKNYWWGESNLRPEKEANSEVSWDHQARLSWTVWLVHEWPTTSITVWQNYPWAKSTHNSTRVRYPGRWGCLAANNFLDFSCELYICFWSIMRIYTIIWMICVE